MAKKNINRFLIGPMVLIYVYAWHAQASLLLNTDVSWLFYAAKQFVRGGSYAHHFLETNPPLIIYLLAPIVFLQKFFQLDTMVILRAYVFLIASLSLYYSYHLLNKIILEEHALVRLILMTAIIALMAGIGFALKPYFYLPLLCIEIYYLATAKKLSCFFHKEIVIIFGVGIIYCSMIVLFNYDYITIIVPLIKHMYYAKYQQNIASLLFNDQSIYAYFVVGLYGVLKKINFYKKLSTLLVVVLMSFWMVFLWQHIGWAYHSLPFYMYAVLLCSLLFAILIMQPSLGPRQLFSIEMISASLLCYYNVKMSYINLSVLYYPNMLFVLACSLFAALFFMMAGKPKLIKIIFILSVIFAVNFIFYHYTQLTIFRKYLFSLTVGMLLLNFLLWAPKKKLFYGNLAMVGMIFFIYPFYKTASVLHYSHYYQKLYQQLVSDMGPYSNKERVYFFTLTSELVFPLIDYAKLNYVSRFWSLVWLPTLQQPDNIAGYSDFYHRNQQELDFYIQAILSDFSKKNPTIVAVDIRKKGYFFNVPPDYIQLFSNNSAFRAEWQHYHLQKIIDFPPLYKFAIYAKNSTNVS